MLLAFVMGYMNFIWMGLITLIVVLEKLPQIGIIIKKPLGGILILLGICSAVINLT
jgi:predicted metal-binding membrane protein